MSLRPIDPSAWRAPPSAREFGAVPMLQWLPIVRLRVDETYQRSITRTGAANVARIVAGFRWSRFSPVIVSPIAGGDYAIVDGQHRTTAAAVLGFEQVPCQVIIADRAEQADAFKAINNGVTRVSSMMIFHAAVAAGDPSAVTVSRVCAQANVRILRSNRSTGAMDPGDCTAPQALLDVLSRHGRRVLRLTLDCFTGTSNNVPGALAGVILRGLARVIDNRSDLAAIPSNLLFVADTIEIEQAYASFRQSWVGGERYGKETDAFANHLGGLFDAARETLGL